MSILGRLNCLFGLQWWILSSSSLVFADFSNGQFTVPQQNISGTFGLQLNSYPSQSASSSASSSSGTPYYGSPSSAGQYYPPFSSSDPHYGYPSPEQLAQIPAPPLRPQMPATATSPYDWRQQQTQQQQYSSHHPAMPYPYNGATQQYNPEQSISSNNNLPYSQQQQPGYGANGLGGSGAQAPYGGNGGASGDSNRLTNTQMAGQQYDAAGGPYGGQYGGQQQQQWPSREQQQQQYQQQQQQYTNALLQQQNRPLNPQYQSPSGRIVFPASAQQDQARHSSFWFNSATRSPHHPTSWLCSLGMAAVLLLATMWAAN